MEKDSFQLTKMQTEAIEEALPHLEDVGKAAIIMPTGQGKTLVAHELSQRFGLKKMLFVVPTINLENHLLLRAHKAQYVTYASLHKYENKIKDFDVVVFDELHRSGARTYHPVVRRVINSAKHSIGITATRYRFMENKRDMALELFGAHVVDKVKDYPLIPSKLTYVGFRHADEHGKVSFKDWIVCEHLLKYLSNKKKTLVFLSSIEELEEQVPYLETIFSDRKVYRAHSKKDSDKDIEAFSTADKAVMCSVNMFNEGVHVKGADSIIMARATESPNIYLQQLGRVLAIDNDTNPIVLDLVNNFRVLRKVFNEIQEFNVRLNSPKKMKVEKEDDGSALLILDSFQIAPAVLNSMYGELQESSIDAYLKTWCPVMGERALLNVEGYDPIMLYNRAVELKAIRRRKWKNCNKVTLIKVYRDLLMETTMERGALDCESMAVEIGLTSAWKSYELDLLYFNEEEKIERPMREIENVKRILGYK